MVDHMNTTNEKAIIVRYELISTKGHSGASDEALAELNSLLAEGWRVKQACGMSGTQLQFACSLVILER